jgi:hypothetical protein
MIKGTKLSFDILDTNSCKTLGLYDTSFYSSNQTIANATLQVISPFDDEPVELDYYKNAITILNSNTLKITNVLDTDLLVDLPDGLYTAKISICPEERFWFEKSWYRTCLLECKYDKAFLKLNVQSCDSCFSPEKLQKLERARIYIYGVKTNATNCNVKEADKLYKAANKILDNLIDCDCES